MRGGIMTKLKIIYNRKNCIGAGACAAMDPDHFEMADDGKADLKGGKEVDGKFELEVEENDAVKEAGLKLTVHVV